MMISKTHTILILCSFWINHATATIDAKDPIQIVLNEWLAETEIIRQEFNLQTSFLFQELREIRKALNTKRDIATKVELLIKKDILFAKLREFKEIEQTELSKIRYLKGLQIIKILYEKTLALDHHFASVSSFREINTISNQNNYPEFSSVKQLINSKKDKRNNFNLSGILGDNIYTSVIHSFVQLFTQSSTSEREKETVLKNVECILDFTLRMHNDLNTIYFETVFLQKSNEAIMSDLEQLFIDYAKPIQYSTSLKECRDSDDWDSVRANLTNYLDQLEIARKDSNNPSKAHNMQINLHFPIDRLLQFITQYNAFIDQGEKFYEKFGIMLNSYENEQQCQSEIPVEYQKLKEGVKIAIEKFNTAYKPVEINGSKLKEVLYGINEYD